MDIETHEAHAQNGISGSEAGATNPRNPSRLKLVSNSKRATSMPSGDKPKRVRPKDSERRPASKAKICNVRMSFEEAARLKQIAAASGEKSLQDFMYQQVRRIIDGATGSVAALG